MSIERSERRMFKALTDAEFKIEVAMEHLEDSIQMSYSAVGSELVIELQRMAMAVGKLNYKIGLFVTGGNVEGL